MGCRTGGSLTRCGELREVGHGCADCFTRRPRWSTAGWRPSLRRLAKATKDATQARRLLALAEIYDGGSRTDAARIGVLTLQIGPDWVLRFNKHGPEGLINGKAPGNRPKLTEEQRQALASGAAHSEGTRLGTSLRIT